MSDPEVRDRLAREHAERLAAKRAAYTWGQMPVDLAYATSLTLTDATQAVEELKRSNVHPFDALPQVIRIFTSGLDRHSDVPRLTKAVVELIRLERTLDQGN
jgi:hypothetical protein